MAPPVPDGIQVDRRLSGAELQTAFAYPVLYSPHYFFKRRLQLNPKSRSVNAARQRADELRLGLCSLRRPVVHPANNNRPTEGKGIGGREACLRIGSSSQGRSVRGWGIQVSSAPGAYRSRANRLPMHGRRSNALPLSGIPVTVGFWSRQNPKAQHPGRTEMLKAGTQPCSL